MIVLVTGCRSGFGLLAAVSAARAGHTVYAGLRDLDTADRLRDAGKGLDVTPVQLDVTDAQQRSSVVADIVDRHGAVNALVNNAGIAIAGPLEELTEQEIRRVFEVNVFALWALTNEVLPGMRKQRDGIVINVSSMAGRMALPALGAYAATKHAVTGMSEALRVELHDQGVRVALVEPGPYKTDILGRNRNIGSAVDRDGPYAELMARVERMEKKISPTAGDPQDVADRIVALLGDPAPAFRHPMGPTTEARRLARWLLPDRAFDRRCAERIAAEQPPGAHLLQPSEGQLSEGQLCGGAQNINATELEMANVVSGMDLEKLEGFRESLKTDPVTLGLHVHGVWEGHSGRSTVHIGPYELGGERIDRNTRHYTVAYGAWKEVEEAIGFVGPTDRLEPVEMALSAVAACLTNSIALNAPRHGIKLEGLEIKVSCELNPSVLFEVKGPEEHTSCMPKITSEVSVKGDITEEQLATIKRLVKYSPVHGMIEYANQCEAKVSRS
jgi:NAD(P)-dependent dehydrogenase (short-subunit alcohol dehydrogenase family)/uncharacterized OsmC-like protein